MKKSSLRKLFLTAILSFLALACLFGCSSNKNDSAVKMDENDLTGDWKEKGAKDSYHYAIINGNIIEMYMVSDNSKSLYWAGTIEKSSDSSKPNTWIIKRDEKKMKKSMVSPEYTEKEFTYENGVIKYVFSIMGNEINKELERVSNTPSLDTMISPESSEANMPVVEKVKVTNEYALQTSSSYTHYYLVVYNGNKTATFVSGQVKAYDSGDNFIGVGDSGGTIGPDCYGLIDVTLQDVQDAKRFESEISIKDYESEFCDVQSLCAFKATALEGKVLVELQYMGEETSTFINVDTLFLDNDGNLLDADRGYLDNLEPKSEKAIQINTDENYSKAIVLLGGSSSHPIKRLEGVDFDPSYNSKQAYLMVEKKDNTSSNNNSSENTTSTDVSSTTDKKEQTTVQNNNASQNNNQSGTKEETTSSSSASTTMSYEEFKKEMDDYEAFFDSYIEFVKSYDSSDLTMLAKYMEMMRKYDEAMKAMDAIDESSLTPEQDAYYLETTMRISNKLMKASAEIGN